MLPIFITLPEPPFWDAILDAQKTFLSNCSESVGKRRGIMLQ